MPDEVIKLTKQKKFVLLYQKVSVIIRFDKNFKSKINLANYKTKHE